MGGRIIYWKANSIQLFLKTLVSIQVIMMFSVNYLSPLLQSYNEFCSLRYFECYAAVVSTGLFIC